MTTAGGMQVMSSDHHGLHHHGHHPHACMLGVPNSPFSPAFSFASSSVTGACSSRDLSAWPHQLGVLNCSSSSAPAASACNSQFSCSSNATACTFPTSSSCFPSSCTGASTSSTSSPSSNLTQAPSPPPLMNSSSSSSHAPLSVYGDLGAYDASAMLPASDVDAAAVATGDASASAPAAASQSELPAALKSTAAAPAGSPNNSVNAPAPPPAASPSSAFNFQFRPSSPYTAGGGGVVDDVDAFLKDAQSSDMEEFLLELLQQPATAAPNSSTGSNAFFGTNPTEQPAGMQMQMLNTARQQQQQPPGAASTYQSLMEMALDSSPTFMDATVTAAPDTHSPSFSYMESEQQQQQRSKSSFCSGGVKPSFVVSPTNNNHSVLGNTNNPGQVLYSSSNPVVSTFMDTSSDSNAYSTGLGSGSSNNNHNHRTFLEAMSSRGGSGVGVFSSQQPDQWMNVGSKGAASEVDELEKEFMRIYGSNVNLRMGGLGAGGRMVKVESEPNILHLRDGMDSVTSFTSALDHHQFESAEGDTVMLELDSLSMTMNHPLPDGSGSMNQLTADALVSSGMDLGFQQHSHGGMMSSPYSTGLSDNPTLQLQQQQQHQPQHAHHLGLGAGGMGFLSDGGMGRSSGLSSSWPGGAAGSAGYKHYPQPLAQLKSNKMSVNFMAAQPASNSSTLALVQAFAPASTAGSSTSSPGYGRGFLSSHSLPNLQQLPASQPLLQLGDMGGQLNRSNSLPSQRGQGSSGTSTSTSHAPSPLGAGATGNSYLSHSMSFPAGSLLGQRAHPHPHAQHKPASNSYQQLGQAPEFLPLQVSSNSLQYRPAHLYRTHNPNAPNSGGMELQDVAGSVMSAAVPDPAVMAMGLQLVRLLLACAEAVAEDNMELAHVLLERLSTLVAPLGSPIQRLAAYFAEALAARVTRKTRSDLFRGLHGDKSVPKTEKLEALSVLYDCIPNGKFGHLTSNQVLLDAIENDRNVHLIDLHMWYGMQWPAFFQALATREGGPPNLRISAVGPSYDELKDTGETLQECAKQLNLPLEYCPIVVPLEEFNIRLLELRRGEVCVVNSFCQLHCLLHKGDDNFNRILRGLRSLNPKVFALTENDGNHNSLHFPARFMACLHYYSAVFDAFDSSLPHDSPVRMKIEQLFAAQKIRNIIACEGTDRVERHESMTEWAKRMEAAGFSPVPLSSRAVSQADLLLNLYYSNNYTLANNNGYLGLRWSSMPLMGVSAWR